MKMYKKCNDCGKEFCAKDSLGRISKLKKYCSRQCAIMHARYSKNNECEICKDRISNNAKICVKCQLKSRNLSKERNGRWKGGTSEGYKISTYKNILLVNGRELNKCERCGLIPDGLKPIVVHHKDRNHDNNDINNLEVLCRKCHAIEHSNETTAWKNNKGGILK